MSDEFIAMPLKEVEKLKKCIKYLKKKKYTLSKGSIESRSPSKIKFGSNRVRVFKGKKVVSDTGKASPKKSQIKSLLKRKSKKIIFVGSNSPRRLKKSKRSKSKSRSKKSKKKCGCGS